MTGKYDDIIHLPHHVSSTRPHMKAIDRAAQFAPFAALTSYDAAVKETAEISIRYFQPDDKKDGGYYVTAKGSVKKIDKYERIVLMIDSTAIPIDEIISIDGKIFE